LNSYQLIYSGLAGFIFNKYLILHINIGSLFAAISLFIINQRLTAAKMIMDVNKMPYFSIRTSKSAIRRTVQSLIFLPAGGENNF